MSCFRFGLQQSCKFFFRETITSRQPNKIIGLSKIICGTKSLANFNKIPSVAPCTILVFAFYRDIIPGISNTKDWINKNSNRKARRYLYSQFNRQNHFNDGVAGNLQNCVILALWGKLSCCPSVLPLLWDTTSKLRLASSRCS